MSVKFTGVFLVICSGLLLSGGAVIGGCAGWSLFHLSHHFWTTHLGVELGSGVLVLAACALCLPACWLATVVPFQPRSTALHGTLMALLLGAMVLLSSGLSAVASLGRELQKEGLLNASMQQALARYDLDPAYRSAFARMQLELHCCGVSSPRDWYQVRAALPASCCGMAAEKSGEPCRATGPRPGCLRPAAAQLRAYTGSVSLLGYCLVVVLAATMFATAHLTSASLLARPDALGGLKLQQLRLACVTAPAPTAPAPAAPAAAAPTAPGHYPRMYELTSH